MTGNHSLQTMGTASSRSKHGRIALFTSITTPVICSIDALFHFKIESSQTEVPRPEMTSHTDSINHSQVNHLGFMINFDDIGSHPTC